MNEGSFNIVNVGLLTVGAILIYCGVKNISPKDALNEIITGSKAKRKVSEAETGSEDSSFTPGEGRSGGGGGGGGSGSW